MAHTVHHPPSTGSTGRGTTDAGAPASLDTHLAGPVDTHLAGPAADALADPVQVGHKFSRQHTMRRAGLPVPAFFVLTAEA
ncbi:hypothetical protein, partial [Streptomyces sp. NPDC052015]